MSLRKKSDENQGPRRATAVIGTAGHIDHGKTTLVRTLTGIDTDRLIEEKKRGISIELGFAFLELGDERAAIIDVPGHERFVRQMIAGAAGVDIVLLVIAADEGVMPQTLEHLDICNLLGVGAGAVVLTKTDLVDPDWLELVKDDVAQSLQGSFLEGAPMFEFSALEPERVEALRLDLASLLQTTRAKESMGARSVERPFKMSIDRVFTMRGFGTVLTGTTASGRIALGDSITLLPEGKTTRVRGIQVHGESVTEIEAGSRAAINLQNIDHHDVSRSDVLTSAGGLEATRSFDGTLRALSRLEKPIKNRAKVLVHVGTAQIQGTLVLLGCEDVQPGQEVCVQVRLDAPTAILPGEPYIIRGFEVLKQYGKTLGGGRALLPSPRAHRRKSMDAVALIEALQTRDPRTILEGWLTYHGSQGVALETLRRTLPLDDAGISKARSELQETTLETHGRLFSRSLLDHVKTASLALVQSFHEAQPARGGMSLEEARSRLEGDAPEALIQCAFEALIGEGRLGRRQDKIHVTGFEATLNPRQEALCAQVKTLLAAGKLTPSRVQDLPEELDLTQAQVKEALELLAESDQVIRVTHDLAYDAEVLRALQEELVTFLNTHGTIDTAGLKTMTGASRKWTIPLGEYFDRIRLTLRVGEGRRLR